MKQAAQATNRYVDMGQTFSLTEDFEHGADGHVTVLYGAGVDTLIIVGDIRDLEPAVGEQVDSGICQRQRDASALPMKETNTHTYISKC